VVLPYVPAGQAVHAAEVAPTVEYVPVGHGKHPDKEVAPPVEYVPAGHCIPPLPPAVGQ